VENLSEFSFIIFQFLPTYTNASLPAIIIDFEPVKQVQERSTRNEIDEDFWF
jgi:hypothetical protein